MPDKLREQLENIYQGIDGDDPSKMTPILDFIDQNFIGKEEVRKIIGEREELTNPIDLLVDGAIIAKNNFRDKLLELIK